MFLIGVFVIACVAWVWGLSLWQEQYVVEPRRELAVNVQRYVERSIQWFNEACSADFRNRTDWIRTCDDHRSEHYEYLHNAKYMPVHTSTTGSWGEAATIYGGPMLGSLLLLLLGVHLIGKAYREWKEERQLRHNRLWRKKE